ncbi:MAG: sulfoxide reductase heme-binding subunit YedZ [Chloroflexi bacterium]|nr:sulfoxide reductase heme-binding subunit YedZ [Chloroflexota bacterium]
MPRFKFTKFQIAVHLGSLIPLILLIWDYFADNLTVNPIQDITFRTGKAALVLLVLSLACTPLNTVFGFKEAIKVRRALGLYAFLYVALHFLTFIGLDYGFDLGLIYEAIFEKRYALVGFAAFLILLPLAITSMQWWMKKLGKNWKRLHRLVYVAGLLAVVHYVWLVKSDIREPLAYGGVVVLLLISRIPAFKKAVMKLRGGLIKRMETDPTPDRV